MKKIYSLILLCQIAFYSAQAQHENPEKYRPDYHFTPNENWMNDPNGMVYKDGLYHLFYQHNPNSSKWGPMHWGHAVSKDLITWDHRPIALYPDSLGTIFSGSAVVDKNNTAGFGKDALVALYTSNFEERIDSKRVRTQTQSIAYSTDNGKTWVKYAGNPVLENPGKRAYRDPKVFWHEGSSKWIMSITEGEIIGFYASEDLKKWDKLSEFGEGIGIHGGVWECPDLIPFEFNGKQIWLLIVSINPKGPNGGSGTQYFLGDFDGTTFTSFDDEVRWLDYGMDNYAGVTWSNTEDKALFIGWMSNWLYANLVPTEKWRSTMTTVRDLSIIELNGKYYLNNYPIEAYNKNFVEVKNHALSKTKSSLKGLNDAFKIQVKGVDLTKDFTLKFMTPAKEELVFSYDVKANDFAINRSETGHIRFHENYAKKMFASNLLDAKTCDIDIYIDKSSIEVFVNKGAIAITALFFNEQNFDLVELIEGNISKPLKVEVWKK